MINWALKPSASGRSRNPQVEFDEILDHLSAGRLRQAKVLMQQIVSNRHNVLSLLSYIANGNDNSHIKKTVFDLILPDIERMSFEGDAVLTSSVMSKLQEMCSHGFPGEELLARRPEHDHLRHTQTENLPKRFLAAINQNSTEENPFQIFSLLGEEIQLETLERLCAEKSPETLEKLASIAIDPRAIDALSNAALDRLQELRNAYCTAEIIRYLDSRSAPGRRNGDDEKSARLELINSCERLYPSTIYNPMEKLVMGLVAHSGYFDEFGSAVRNRIDRICEGGWITRDEHSDLLGALLRAGFAHKEAQWMSAKIFDLRNEDGDFPRDSILSITHGVSLESILNICEAEGPSGRSLLHEYYLADSEISHFPEYREMEEDEQAAGAVASRLDAVLNTFHGVVESGLVIAKDFANEWVKRNSCIQSPLFWGALPRPTRMNLYSFVAHSDRAKEIPEKVRISKGSSVPSSAPWL